jgi:hypothetical protein
VCVLFVGAASPFFERYFRILIKLFQHLYHLSVGCLLIPFLPKVNIFLVLGMVYGFKLYPYILRFLNLLIFVCFCRQSTCLVQNTYWFIFVAFRSNFDFVNPAFVPP